MKKLIILLLILTLVGCTRETNSEGVKRFKTISRETSFKIVYDTQTKVQYAVSWDVYNYGCLTLLVNADGTPLLYEE